MGVPLWANVLIYTFIAVVYLGLVLLLTGWSEEVWPPSKPWYMWVRFAVLAVLIPFAFLAAAQGRF